MQSNRKITRRNTRTRTVMISFDPETEEHFTSTGINNSEAVPIIADSVSVPKSDNREIISSMPNASTNTNINGKIEIFEREYDFQKMREVFERKNVEQKSSELVIVKLETETKTKKEIQTNVKKEIPMNKKEKQQKIHSDKKEKQKEISMNKKEIQTDIKKIITAETTIQDAKKDKNVTKSKDNVNNHDKDTVSHDDNNLNNEERMFKFDHLMHLWTNRLKKN